MLGTLAGKHENDSVTVRLGVRFAVPDGLTHKDVVVLGRPQDLCCVLLIVDDGRHAQVRFPSPAQG